MKISNKALELIKEKRTRRRLCEVLDMFDQTIQDYIRKNKNNGPLTTYKALEVIREETGLTDSDILVEDAPVKASDKSNRTKRVLSKL